MKGQKWLEIGLLTQSESFHLGCLKEQVSAV